MTKVKDRKKMATTILDNIKGTELPRQWAERISDNLNQDFTVIIKPKTEINNEKGLQNTLPRISPEERRRIFELLEKEGDNEEYSEEWIARIKKSRINSPLKAIFE